VQPPRRGQLSGRGVAYWTTELVRARDLMDERAIGSSSRCQTAHMIKSFGTNGVVDLKVGVVKGVDQQSI